LGHLSLVSFIVKALLLGTLFEISFIEFVLALDEDLD
jgi:hypothetical protein